MSSTIIIPILVSLIVGGVLFYFGRSNPAYRVNGFEFGIGFIFTAVVVTWPVNYIGNHMAQDSVVDGYHEFWNGSIIAAEESGPISCSRDGDCRHTYQCDPYEVPHTVIDYDSKGRMTGSHTEYTTEYHNCPEATVEHDYWIRDSFGRKIDIYLGAFEVKAKAWRGNHISVGVLRGQPPFWVDVRNKITAGDPPPSTKTNEYPNYLLSSTHTILKRYSPDIEKYKKYLVPHTANYNNPLTAYDTQAQKVVVAGGANINLAAWNDALAHLNAQLGTQRQGDMHIIVVPADKVDPDSYINAVMAYWQDTNVFGKWVLGKNSIAVAIGVNDTSVMWMRAKTGMPVDNNGAMSSAIALVRDIPLDPLAVIGSPRAVIGKKITWTATNGAIEAVVLHAHPFVRACMGHCGDKGDSGTGFVYLKKDVVIPGSAKVTIVFIALLLNIWVWIALYYLPDFSPIQRKNY